MTNAEKLMIMKDRLNRLENCPKDAKCPGALAKLRREIRNIEKQIASET